MVQHIQFHTLWKGFRQSTWENEQNLHQYGDIIRQYWQTDRVEQCGADNKQHTTFERQALARAAARARGSIFVPPGYALKATWEDGPQLRSQQMEGAYFYMRTEKEGWHLGFIHGVALEPDELRPYLVNFVDQGLRYHVSLEPGKYSTSINAPAYSWCYLMHVKSRSVKRQGF